MPDSIHRSSGWHVQCRRSAALGLAFACSAVHAAGCPATQQTLFTCSTGRSTLAVCTTPDLSVTTGTLQYRFGRTGAVPWTYPLADADWRAVTRGATLAFSGGGGAYLAFDRPPYRYVVYTATGRGWGRKAGVVTEKDGLRIANLVCKGKERAELGPDLFERAGVSEDTVGFDLP